LSTLPFIVAIAIAWHFGLAIFEHRRRPEHDRPSIAKLLLLAEVEVLRALRAELRRRSRRGGNEQRREKLSQVESKLKELNEVET